MFKVHSLIFYHPTELNRIYKPNEYRINADHITLETNDRWIVKDRIEYYES